jgi:hypothetical protein
MNLNRLGLIIQTIGYGFIIAMTISIAMILYYATMIWLSNGGMI